MNGIQDKMYPFVQENSFAENVAQNSSYEEKCHFKAYF